MGRQEERVGCSSFEYKQRKTILVSATGLCLLGAGIVDPSLHCSHCFPSQHTLVNFQNVVLGKVQCVEVVSLLGICVVMILACVWKVGSVLVT